MSVTAVRSLLNFDLHLSLEVQDFLPVPHPFRAKGAEARGSPSILDHQQSASRAAALRERRRRKERVPCPFVLLTTPSSPPRPCQHNGVLTGAVSGRHSSVHWGLAGITLALCVCAALKGAASYSYSPFCWRFLKQLSASCLQTALFKEAASVTSLQRWGEGGGRGGRGGVVKEEPGKKRYSTGGAWRRYLAPEV